MSDSLIEFLLFLRARLDEDSLWATEASRRGNGPAVEGGAHWRWEDPSTDRPIEVNPGQDEFVGGERFRVSLRSREEWPTGSGMGPLPQFAIPEAEEVPSAVGGHIVRHDPARVMRDVEAKRQQIAHLERVQAAANKHPDYALAAGACEASLRYAALAYVDHPDYRQEWKP
jgi:hypothetical protein